MVSGRGSASTLFLSIIKFWSKTIFLNLTFLAIAQLLGKLEEELTETTGQEHDG